MRRMIIGLAIVGVLTAVGCSDSDVGGEAAGGSSTEDFCAEFQALDERFSDDPDASSDEVVEALEGLDPPDEIADDYATVVDATRELAELDTSDPEASQRAQELSEEAGDAQTRVSDFLQNDCDIDLGG